MTRCWWCGEDPVYVAYHDDVWGRPMHGERALFEMLTLESFQSGLSWITILRKQEHFRRAFSGWDIEAIAAYGDADFERLMGDAGIVRNRAKVEATMANARATVALHDAGETLDDLLWSFAPGASPAPRSREDMVSFSPESKAMAGELKRRGFRFVGPTTAYSLMQAAGLVNDHLAGCSFR
ncbi:MAG: DNA-3-methyladenine glycosylase [Solirubrobacterales bacterium]|nr:DNA-3-methyladenine glycosylase [Solirubrobacterales bacterium]